MCKISLADNCTMCSLSGMKPMNTESTEWLKLAIKARDRSRSAHGIMSKILRAEMRGAALNAVRS